MEAWIQLDGFSGAARGIELMHLLCERFWEEMYPALDNDLEPRLAPIKWVNDKLSRRIRLVRLTQPSMEGMAAYSLAEWDVAMRNPGGATSGETVTVGKFEQSVKLTAYAWFVGLQRDVKETLDRLAALDDLIDEKAGKLAPGLIKFRNEVAAAARLVEAMLSATRGPEPEAPTPAQIAIAGDEGIGGQSMLPSPQPPMMPELIPDAASAAGVPGMRIRSRAEAYSLLEEIAEFLRRNDPHSPTPYLISRAVAWGGMHFDELLPELVRDRGELSEILKLLNLDPPSSKL
jgi:type VI secretion system ImpA family protein